VASPKQQMVSQGVGTDEDPPAHMDGYEPSSPSGGVTRRVTAPAGYGEDGKGEARRLSGAKVVDAETSSLKAAPSAQEEQLRKELEEVWRLCDALTKQVNVHLQKESAAPSSFMAAAQPCGPASPRSSPKSPVSPNRAVKPAHLRYVGTSYGGCHAAYYGAPSSALREDSTSRSASPMSRGRAAAAVAGRPVLRPAATSDLSMPSQRPPAAVTRAVSASLPSYAGANTDFPGAVLVAAQLPGRPHSVTRQVSVTGMMPTPRQAATPRQRERRCGG